jgi:hypothetical protein
VEAGLEVASEAKAGDLVIYDAVMGFVQFRIHLTLFQRVQIHQQHSRKHSS